MSAATVTRFLIMRKGVVDTDGQLWDTEFFAKALRAYVEANGTLRLNFTSDIADAKVVDIVEDDEAIYADVEWRGEPVGWATMVAPGIVRPRVIQSDVAPKGVIVDGEITQLALVDRGVFSIGDAP